MLNTLIYESVPDPDTTPIKLIDDDEMDYLLESFHSESDDNIFYFDLQMMQTLLVVVNFSKM